jgi:hypothetical protein
MKNYTFTRWWGPLVGALAGMLVALYTRVIRGDSLGFWPPVIGGTVLGLAAGFLIMLVDPAPSKQPEDASIDPLAKPSLAGNILCALSLIFFFMPFFSILLSGLALFLNWRIKGWARRLSWVGLILGLSITSLMVWHWMSGANEN